MTLLSPLVCFLIFMTLHIILWRILPSAKKGLFLKILLSVLSTSLFVGLSKIIDSPINFEHLLYTFSGHFFLVMLYLHLYVGIDRSVSIRVLGELVKAPEKKLTLEQLEVIYPQKHMFSHRIETMLQNGWLVKKQGFYSTSEKAQGLVAITLFLHKFYGIEVAG